LRLSEWAGALGGLGLLVASFLPWYSAGGQNVTAWQAFSVTDILIALAAFFSLSVAISVVGKISVSYPVAGSTVATLFGAIALVLIVYRLLNPPGDGLDVEYGAWIGLVSALAATYGGYLGMQPLAATRPPHHERGAQP
jgi:hypothetical protein